MTPEDARRLREAFATASLEATPTSSCPAPERIWEAVQDELSRPEAREILEHIASCPVCTEAWRLAAHLEDEGRSSKIPESYERSARGRWLGVGGAVAAAVAYFLVGVATHDLAPAGSIARSGATSELEKVSATQSRSDCTPAWTVLDGAHYDVEVFDQNLELIAAADGLETAAFQIAESSLPPQARLLIHIRAYDSTNGAPLAERTLEFECTR